MTVAARGQGFRERLCVVPAARLDPDDRRPTLRGEAQTALIELLNPFAPCKAKAKVKGKHRIQQGPVSFERTLTGEGELTLNEDGAFAMTVPDAFVLTSPERGCRLTEQGGVCQAADYTCTFIYQPRPAQWTWSGTYRTEEGALMFTEIRAEGVNTQAVAQCCGPDGCVNYS